MTVNPSSADVTALARILRDPEYCRADQREQAADVLDAIAPLDDTRPTCPTCGGTGIKPDPTNTHLRDCPDCTDGRVPLARRIEQLVALWNREMP